MTDEIYDLRDPSYQQALAARLRGEQPVPAAQPPAPPLSPVQPAGVQGGPVAVPNWLSKGAARGKRGPPEKYQFRTLEVGGTFRVPPGPDQPAWSSFRTICSYKGTDLGKKFRCHRYPDGTFEVWRES